MEFQSRAVRSLVELHERELRACVDVWQRFVTADAPLPEAHGDEDYASREHLLAHVLKAARNFLVRISEWLGRPVSDMDPSEDAHDIAARAPAFTDSILSAWRRQLAPVTNGELEPQVHRTRLGYLMSVEMLFEHAIVHAMRHRIQLERILEGGETRPAGTAPLDARHPGDSNEEDSL